MPSAYTIAIHQTTDATIASTVMMITTRTHAGSSVASTYGSPNGSTSVNSSSSSSSRSLTGLSCKSIRSCSGLSSNPDALSHRGNSTR